MPFHHDRLSRVGLFFEITTLIAQAFLFRWRLFTRYAELPLPKAADQFFELPYMAFSLRRCGGLLINAKTQRGVFFEQC